MAAFTFTATAHVKITVEAANDILARAAVFADLQDADTDFIRSDHWDERSMRAEFHIVDVEPAQ